MLPNFLVIGAAKSGTTRLCALLGRHAQVFMCQPKEPHFFARDPVYARGLAWYQTLFADAAGKAAVGEGSTTYTKHHLHPHASRRIAEHLPNARLIYLARHPLRRMESGYLEALKGRNAVSLDFNRALRAHPHFVDTSLYWKQLGFYRQHFADERILTLLFEDFNADPAGTLRRCFTFLGVEPSVTVGGLDEQHNVSQGQAVDSALWARLRRRPLLRATLRRAFTFVPRRLRDRWLRTRITERPCFDDATRAWATQQVRDDSQAFLHYCDKPATYWPL